MEVLQETDRPDNVSESGSSRFNSPDTIVISEREIESDDDIDREIDVEGWEEEGDEVLIDIGFGTFEENQMEEDQAKKEVIDVRELNDLQFELWQRGICDPDDEESDDEDYYGYEYSYDNAVEQDLECLLPPPPYNLKKNDDLK